MNEGTPTMNHQENCEEMEPDGIEEYEDDGTYDNNMEDEEDFRPRGRGRGFRGARGAPRNWNSGTMPGPREGPPRFRGRGYGPGGPPFRGRGPPPPLFGRGGPPPRNGPNFPNFGPPGMGPPGQLGPPGMMGPPMGPPNWGPPGMGGPPPHMMERHPGPQNFNANSGNNQNNSSMPLDMNGEIWVETKTQEGKSYYYNARTRETTWTKPEGPSIKIISQDQVEAMAQAVQGGGPGGQGPQQQGPPGQQQQMRHPGEQNDEQDEGGSNQGEVRMSPSQHAPGMHGPPPGLMQGPPPGLMQGPPPTVPFGQFGMPPPGWLPPWGMQGLVPQQQQTNTIPPLVGAGNSSSGQGGMMFDDAMIMAHVDPDIIAKASEWSEHRAPDGRSYYYNAKKGESVWERPKPLKDLDAAKMTVAQNFSNPSKDADSASKDGSSDSRQGVSAPGDSSTADSAQRDGMGAPGVNATDADKKKQDDDGNKIKKDEDDKQTQQKNNQSSSEPPAQQRIQDKSRPISSTPVPGTPWCVVWTGDGRVFFYNPSSRTSVWERPEDLIGRSDVDKMLATPPDVLVPQQTGAATGKNEGGPQSGAIPTGKRMESDSSDSEEGTPAKKAKKDTSAATSSTNGVKPEKRTIDIGKEAAIEAEVRAAKERAVVPLETRIKSFREMLAEKEVSAFSTWEKELHKIVFDPRYLLLTSKERKQVFEKYVKERAEDERREKRNRLRERKDAFRKLLTEAHLHGKSSFSDFAQKYAKDERFKNVEKMREREGLFNEYLIEVRKREKEEKSHRREQAKRDFHALLREHSDIDRHTRWSDVKKKIDADLRYKSVDSSNLREDWFREYCKILKDEKKKAKEKDREHKREKEKHKSSKKDKDKESRSSRSRTKDNLQAEQITSGDEMETDEKGLVESEETENIKNDTDDERAREEKEKEKQARAEASLREREKEVQRTLATHLRDRDKEREQHKRDEAIQHFNALLADLVRNADLTWREAKRQLRKDHRWEFAELLAREDKERLYAEHVDQLLRRKRDKFRELLDETAEVSLTSSWKDIRRIIKDDPRYSKFASSERCEREFRDYIKDKLVAAKADFKELLHETKLITHKSLTQLRENENHMAEIEEILKNDRRYLVLDYIPHERTQLIISYLEELDKRGPPPPPTASEPSRRPVK